MATTRVEDFMHLVGKEVVVGKNDWSIPVGERGRIEHLQDNMWNVGAWGFHVDAEGFSISFEEDDAFEFKPVEEDTFTTPEEDEEFSRIEKKQQQQQEDLVNHPPHYTSHPSGIECIQITEHMNFCLGNAMKYLWRAGIKDASKKKEDLEKAVFYIKRELEGLDAA